MWSENLSTNARMKRWLAIGLSTVVVIAIVASVFVFFSSSRLFLPRYEYAHIRVRLFVHGTEVDVSDLFSSYTLYRGACSGRVQNAPMSTVKKDPHSVRLMWKGLTGEDLFAFLGIGALGEKGPHVLGYTLGLKLPRTIPVPAHTRILPQAQTTNTFIYVRSGDGFIERPLPYWLAHTLEENMGRNSQIKLSWFSDIALAHEGETEIDLTSTDPLVIAGEQEEARVLNNILGDAVIFLDQQERPSDEEIENIFATFPLIAGGLCDEVV